MVVNKVFLCLFLSKVLKRVGPENVAHKAVSRGLAETVDLGSVSVQAKAVRNGRNIRS